MMRRINKIAGLSIVVSFLLQLNLFAEQVRLDKKWDDPLAYRPYPVLFLHGFAKGSPKSWNKTPDDKPEQAKKKATEVLKKYFSEYFRFTRIPEFNHDGYLPDSRYWYLETINFQDPNGSVDTYPPGKTNPQGDNKGWADKLDPTITNLLDNYSDESFQVDKLLLVAHSMGGLAGRECLSKTEDPYPSRSKVESLTMTGTPNLGTKWADLAEGVSKFNKVTKFPRHIVWVLTKPIGLLNDALEELEEIVRGEAVDDMTTDSPFLTALNSRNVSDLDVKYFVIAGTTWKFPWWLCNAFLFRGKGDGVVSLGSQMGKDLSNTVFPLKGKVPISACHLQECTNIATSGELIKFLDYTTPVLEITKVNGEPLDTEVDASTTSVTVEGTLAKEYLPADTKIKYQVYDEDENPMFDEEKEMNKDVVFFPLDISQLSL
ncbi:MAG: hypothetical protein KAX20_01360 [Candidatus Omnitrophica bacterium]|nr:hypothetical protein [Candidatus Omnitrophota bacterium]